MTAIIRRLPTTTAVVTDEDGVRSDVLTFDLGSWEQGALQVLLDAVRGSGFLRPETLSAVLGDLADAETTLGNCSSRVLDSLDVLGSLVRGFSQADEVTITATVR
jgi:hypothetical protein